MKPNNNNSYYNNNNKPQKSSSLQLQIDRQSQNLDKNNIHTVLETLIKQLKEKVLENQEIQKIKNKKITLNLCLEKNKLCCTAIGMIVDILLQFKELIKLGILRLHMNCVKDRGAEKLSLLFKEFRVKELHLSHNYITDIGFKAMVHSILSSPMYHRKGITPIWMRLEFNIIKSDALIDILLANEDRICLVPMRGTRKNQCNIHFCAANNNGRIIDIHLPYIKEQKQLLCDLYSSNNYHDDDDEHNFDIEEKLEKLLERNVENVNSNEDEVQVAPSPSLNDGSDGNNNIAANSEIAEKKKLRKRKNKKKNSKNSINRTPTISNNDSLLIVLDTCVIIHMCNKSSPFSFERLLQLYDSNSLFNIKLILIDTVFQQLDDRKKETNNKNERYAIKQFLDLYLVPCIEANILHFIHPIELEDEVRARGGHISQRNFRKDNGQFDSDGLILDCTYFLIENAKNQKKIIFLTDDRLCKSRALLHGIPSDSLNSLESSLSKQSYEILDSSVLFNSLSNECLSLLSKEKPSNLGYTNNSGDHLNLSNDNNSANNNHHNNQLSRPTLLSELQSAIEVTALLSQFISLTSQYVPGELQPKILEIQKITSSKSQHWRSLLSSHQLVTPLLYTEKAEQKVDSTPDISDINDIVDKISKLSVSSQ